MEILTVVKASQLHHMKREVRVGWTRAAPCLFLTPLGTCGFLH